MTMRQVIQAMPVKALAIMAKLSDTSDGAVKTRDRLLEELKGELDQINAQEEEHLYPVLRKHKDLRNLVREAIEGNKATQALLADLDRTPKDSEEFGTKVAALRKSFQQHVRDEKKELLPAIEKALSEDEANVVVMGFEGRKNGVESDERDDASKAVKPSAQAAAKPKDEKSDAPSPQQRRSESEQHRDADAQRRRGEPAKEVLDGMTEATRAVAETGQRGVRVMQDAMRDEREQIVQKLGQDAEATLEVAKDLSGDLQSLAQTSAVLTRATHAIASEWFNLARGRMWRSLGDLAELSKCRSVSDMYNLQRTLVQNNLGQFAADSQRLASLAMKVTEEASRSIGRRHA